MDAYTSPSFSPSTPTYATYAPPRMSPYTASTSTAPPPPPVQHVNVHEYFPQEGAQGTQLNIKCDIDYPPGPTASSRAVRVVFGSYPVPTKVTPLSVRGTEQHCQLNVTVPSWSSTGEHAPGASSVPVYIQVLDGNHAIIDAVLLGEFHYVNVQRAVMPRSYSPNPLKRGGESLESHRPSPSLGNRRVVSADGYVVNDSPNTWGNGNTGFAPPPVFPAVQPNLMRTTQLSPTLPQPGSFIPPGQKAKLELEGDLMSMACGWDQDEWGRRRRLVQFWRRQDGTTIHAAFRPVSQDNYVPNSIVISCIYREGKNACFVTSVDAIYLLEALVGVRFTVEEKNRIRRNLEGFRPITISKAKPGSEEFFKLIMGFPNPKPRNIEKDVKVFPWTIFGQALKKIIGKYSASYGNPMYAPPPPPLPVPGPSYGMPMPMPPMQHDAAPFAYEASSGGGTNSADSVPQLTSQSSTDSASSYAHMPMIGHDPSTPSKPAGLGSTSSAAALGLGHVAPLADSPTHLLRGAPASHSSDKLEAYVNLSPPYSGIGVPAQPAGMWDYGPSFEPSQLPHVHQTVERVPSSNDLRVMYPGM
ncbi:hypothetical protein Q5752_001695 [Cryptotrichosporon argae]